MYKKYLGKTKIGDTRKVEEFTCISVNDVKQKYIKI